MKNKTKKYNSEEVDYLFGGMNEVNENQRYFIAEALSKLDKEIVDKLAEEVLFVASYEDRCFFLPLNAKHLEIKKGIFFSEGLFNEKDDFIIKIILHEVAHFILKHKCLFDFEEGKEAEKDKQEEEADELVKKWLKE